VGDFTWRVSDCEELAGGYSQKIMGLDLVKSIRNSMDSIE